VTLDDDPAKGGRAEAEEYRQKAGGQGGKR